MWVYNWFALGMLIASCDCMYKDKNPTAFVVGCIICLFFSFGSRNDKEEKKDETERNIDDNR